MSDERITSLPTLSAIDGSEWLAVATSSTTYRLSSDTYMKAAPPRARAAPSSNTSIPSGTKTRVPLDSVTYDPDGMVDTTNDHVVLNQDGAWLLVGIVQIQGGTSSSGRRLAILNGTALAETISGVFPTTTDATYSLVTTVVQAVSGDTVYLQGFQDSGESKTIGASHSHLIVIYQGA